MNTTEIGGGVREGQSDKQYLILRKARELTRYLANGNTVVCQCDGTSRAVRDCLSSATTLHSEGRRDFCGDPAGGHDHFIAVIKCGTKGLANLCTGIAEK